MLDEYSNLSQTNETLKLRIPFKHNTTIRYKNDVTSHKISHHDSQIIAIMNGWFSHHYYFLPINNLLPVFVGTHFSKHTQNFLRAFLGRLDYKNFRDIGCRDLFTLDFCKKYKIDSYFSRCLTLSLPKRTPKSTQTKIFLVNVKKEFLPYIPDDILKNAEFINQRRVLGERHWSEWYQESQNLLMRYKDEAKLIITNALHCASPCTAFGIPVILIQDDIEQNTRFSALYGILHYYTLQDFIDKKVDFNPKAPNIESLKNDMLINLDLSIKKALGIEIDEEFLNDIRFKIANFHIYNTNT